MKGRRLDRMLRENAFTLNKYYCYGKMLYSVEMDNMATENLMLYKIRESVRRYKR